MKLVDAIVARATVHADWRRGIHAHPELAYNEHRTADFVADRLIEFGIPIVRGLGKTGIVGTVKAVRSDRSIGLRADMDALPLEEMNRFAQRSQHAGVMHAGGHDGHTAMLLAAAEHRVSTRNFDGIVRFICQLAEDGEAGAKAMMDDGLFEDFPMEAVNGLHPDWGSRSGIWQCAPAPRRQPWIFSQRAFTVSAGTPRSRIWLSIRSWSVRNWYRRGRRSCRAQSNRSGP